MDQALKLTYPNKSNIITDPDSVRKFYATEADEIKLVASDHADQIEDLKKNLIDSENPHYGRYTSLALLQAAHTTAEEFGWAIIDQGAGISPQIALWNNTSNTWEVSGVTTDKVFVATENDLPNTGAENTWYITTDKKQLFIWYNNKFNQISAGSTDPQTQVAKYIIPVEEAGQLNFVVPGNPNSIVLIKNGVFQIEGTGLQYTFNTLTATFSLSAFKPAKLTDKFEVIALGVGVTKQTVISNTDNQTEFLFTGNPSVLLVLRNGVWMQDFQYTRTFYNTNNKIILTKGQPVGTLIDFIKI